MTSFKSVGLSIAAAVALTAFAISSSSAATVTNYTFTSDDCTGGCGTNGQGTTNNNFGSINITVGTSSLTFNVSLTGPLAFLGGNGSGIDDSFAFSLANASSITISGASSAFSNSDGTETGGTVKMDGVGNFQNFGYFVECNTCSPSAPDGNSLTFTISSGSLTGAQLLADLQPGTHGSFFAADVMSCETGVTACTGTGTGNTGVIDGTPSAVPLPGAAMLFGSVLFGGLGVSRWRKRRARGPVSLFA